MGRTARGVRGMMLEGDDRIIGMETVTDATAATLVTVTENGYGKRTDLGRIPGPEPGRQGDHHHQDHRAQRQGGRYQAGR